MYLHISFTSGVNPYIFYGKHPGETDKAECLQELRTWQKNYDVIALTEDAGGIYATLSERGNHDTNNSSCGPEGRDR